MFFITFLLQNSPPGEQDEDTRRELQGWKEELIEIGKTLVGSTDVVLFKTREGESNIGSGMIFDYIVFFI